MAENLVIVESPAKAKTINKYLGGDYIVKASMGHIRDLPEKGLGVDIENKFEPTYEVTKAKAKTVSDLKTAAKAAEQVYLCPDPDREGEAIAWHICDAFGLSVSTTKRIVFHEITKSAILHAIEHPREIDTHLVNAQQARRILDRLVGFELSPILWKKIKPNLSAGRVQSVAVRLIVDREREIHQFVSTAAFKISADFKSPSGAQFKAELPERLSSLEASKLFLIDCQKAQFKIGSVDKKPAKRTPSAPFTTSTLQQEASRKLGFSVGQTMSIAQRLYEAGKITYMRTDSVKHNPPTKPNHKAHAVTMIVICRGQ